MQFLRLDHRVLMNHVYHQLTSDIDRALHSYRGGIVRWTMCEDTAYICRCEREFDEYFQLEDHIVSRANQGDHGHRYFAKCVGPTCRIVFV